MPTAWRLRNTVNLLDLSVIQDPKDLDGFVEEWSAFVESHPAATPFHLPAWLITWWRQLGSGVMHVIAFRDQKLRAVIPCFLLEWEGRRQLTLLGSGVTDYLDPLICAGYEQPVIQALERHLESYRDWEVIDWTDVRPDHPIFTLKGAEEREWLPRSEVRFDQPFADFWMARGKDLRRNVRRYRAKAEQLGRIEFEVVDGAPVELMDALVRLHTRRWQAQGESGMIAANRSEEFLRHVASELAKSGIIRFFVLRFGGQVTAVIFAFVFRERVYGYMSAFDPVHSEFSLGKTLLYEALQFSFSRYEAWDFLRGDEAYKLEWGAQTSPLAKLRLERHVGG